MTTPAPAAWLGAAPEHWALWHRISPGDLLPAVPDQTIPRWVTEDGKVTPLDLSKSPSEVVVVSGEKAGTWARGIKGWSTKESTEAEVRRWANSSHNLLLLTRNIRAVDIDVDNAPAADWISQQVENAFPGLPCRRRPDSPRRTFLFRLDNQGAELKKRRIVLADGGGLIEFLANGQQTLLLGTHGKSGTKFEIFGGNTAALATNPPDYVPTISFEKFAALLDHLAKHFMGASDDMRRYRPLSGVTNEDNLGRPDTSALDTQLAAIADPVVQYLQSKGLVRSIRGEGIDVICPWQHEHTEAKGADEDDTSTTYFPSSGDGKVISGFRCLHGHCDRRHTGLFLDACGYTQFRLAQDFPGVPSPHLEVVTSTALALPARTAVAEVVAREARGSFVALKQMLGQARDAALGSGFVRSDSTVKMLEKDKNGRARETLENLQWALESPIGFRFRLDEFTNETTFEVSGFEPQVVKETTISDLRMVVEAALGVRYSKEDMSSRVACAAQYNSFDSAIDTVSALRGTWDGVCRIGTFDLDILSMVPTPYSRSVSRYFWVAMVARAVKPGVKADGSLLLITTQQGKGKTSLVKRLPLRPEWHGRVDLENPDADTFRGMRGKVVMEIPELRGASKREEGSLKAFLDSETDIWRPLYSEVTTRAPRRSVFIATNNETACLTDPTGSRRWFPLMVGSQAEYLDWVRLEAEIEQYWAEALHIIDSFDSPQQAVESAYRAADNLAMPARRFCRVVDVWERKLNTFVRNQIAGTEVALDTLATGALGMSLARVDTRISGRIRSVMTALDFLQLSGDSWQAPANAAFSI